MIEQEQFLCIIKNGVVRGKSWSRQTLSDAWKSTTWEDFCGTPWQMVAPEVKLAKKVTAHKGAGPPLPRIEVDRAPEVEPRRLYVLSADIEVHGHSGGFPACASACIAWKKRQSHIMTNAESESERSLGTLTGKARMNAYKDSIAETER